MHLHKTLLYTALLAITLTRASAAGMAPDDPSVASNLVLWLTDAASTYDVGSGVWSDGSGNSNDAVSLIGLHTTGATYVVPTVNSGATTADANTSALSFSSDLELMRATGLNGEPGFSEITLFSVCKILTIGGSGTAAGNLDRTRPVGIGSTAYVGGNSVSGAYDNIQQGARPTIKFDNGSIANTSYSNTPDPLPSDSFTRVTRLSTGGVFDEWINTNASLNRVIDNVTGTRTPGSGGGNFGATRVDELFLGDLRRMDTTSTFEISQIVIYKSSLTTEQIAGINEWIPAGTTTGGGTVLLIR